MDAAVLSDIRAQLPEPTEADELAEIVPGGLGWEDWVQAGVAVVVAIVAAILVRRLVCRLVDLGDAPMAGRAIARFAAAIVLGFGLVYALNSLGVAVGPLLGALGIGGLALAFALKDILENLISGLILQARSPFAIGDEVITNDYEGSVVDVNLRSVVLRTFDGRKVIVPSSMVLKNPIENDTERPVRRSTVLVGVSYDADAEVARELVLEAARGVDGVREDPTPEAFLESFGASSVDIAVRFWHDSARRSMWETRSAVIAAVKRSLDDADIEIPFPQRVLQLSGEGSAALNDE